MRTDEQRQAFAKECWEIEKQGGDVLEYIRVNWPSYTPGATWFNLQRVYLPDKKMTSGKPQKEGGEEEMRRDRVETLNGILNALKNGEHPYDYLESVGYTNPHQAYVDTRIWARKYNYDAFVQLPVSLKKLQVKPKSAPINFKEEPAPDLRAGEALPLKLPKKPVETKDAVQKCEETVIFEGKTYEKMAEESKKAEESYKKFTETVKDIIKPDKPLRIHSVESDAYQTARYENSTPAGGKTPYMTFAWNDKQRGPCELTLAVSTWEQLLDEIPKALSQLGL